MRAIKRLGRYRHRIRLQRRTGDLNRLGQKPRVDAVDSPDWQDIDTVWARVRQTAGSDPEVANQIVANASHRIEMRYRADVNASCRVIFGGEVLEIKATVDDETDHELTLFCGTSTR